jgi:Ulp1 family protease
LRRPLPFFPFALPVVLGGDIFTLDKLLIPIHINNCHFFTISVDMKRKNIMAVDSLPKENGRKAHLDNILRYLKDEHSRVRPNHTQPEWLLIPASTARNTLINFIPRQDHDTNDCGIFTCLFMDYLMLKLPLHELTQQRIRKYGREWLCSSILNKAIAF